MLSVEQLERLEELDRQASSGPWFVNRTDDDWHMTAFVVSQVEDDEEFGEDLTEYNCGKVLAATYIQQPRYAINENHRANAELIAAMRNALPGLLALARQAGPSART
jgi:hypothetical protein